MKFNLSIFRRPSPESRALTWVPWDQGGDGLVNSTYSGATVTHKTAMTFSAVFAAVTLIADGVSSLPAEAMIGDKQAELPQWIRSPNREIRRFDFWNQMIVSLLLHGNAYAQFLVRPSDGVPIGLVPLDPTRVYVEWNPNVPGERRYKIDNGAWLSRREIMHIQGPTLAGAPKGMSVIAQARESIALGLTLEEYGSRYFGQGSQAKVVIEMPSSVNVDVDKAKQIVAVFERFHRGRGNWHRPAVMSGGAKLHNISIPPEDAQFLQSREFQAVEIARWFRVPPHRIGIVSKQSSWGSGLAEENTAMVQHTFKPWILRVEETLSAYAPGPEGLGMTIRLVDSGLLRGTAKEQADLHIALFEAGLTKKNEARKALGYPLLPEKEDGFVEKPSPVAAKSPPIGKSEPSESGKPGDRTPAKRSMVERRNYSGVTRTIDKVGDNCPQCQANNDPGKVPVHVGCDCNVRTESIELGGVDLPELPITIDQGTSAVLARSGLRYSDIEQWAAQIEELMGADTAISMAADGDAVYLGLTTRDAAEEILEELTWVNDVHVKAAMLRPGSRSGLSQLYFEILGRRV